MSQKTECRLNQSSKVQFVRDQNRRQGARCLMFHNSAQSRNRSMPPLKKLECQVKQS